MRLAIWNTNYFRGFGGAEKAVTNLVNCFSQLGIETFLIANRFVKNQTYNQFFEPLHPSVKTYQDSFANPWDSTDKPFRFVGKLLQYLKAAIQFACFLHRNKIQIIHLHYVSWDVLFLALCKRLFGYRLVITFSCGRRFDCEAALAKPDADPMTNCVRQPELRTQRGTSEQSTER